MRIFFKNRRIFCAIIGLSISTGQAQAIAIAQSSSNIINNNITNTTKEVTSNFIKSTNGTGKIFNKIINSIKSGAKNLNISSLIASQKKFLKNWGSSYIASTIIAGTISLIAVFLKWGPNKYLIKQQLKTFLSSYSPLNLFHSILTNRAIALLLIALKKIKPSFLKFKSFKNFSKFPIIKKLTFSESLNFLSSEAILALLTIDHYSILYPLHALCSNIPKKTPVERVKKELEELINLTKNLNEKAPVEMPGAGIFQHFIGEIFEKQTPLENLLFINNKLTNEYIKLNNKNLDNYFEFLVSKGADITPSIFKKINSSEKKSILEKETIKNAFVKNYVVKKCYNKTIKKSVKIELRKIRVCDLCNLINASDRMEYLKKNGLLENDNAVKIYCDL